MSLLHDYSWKPRRMKLLWDYRVQNAGRTRQCFAQWCCWEKRCYTLRRRTVTTTNDTSMRQSAIGRAAQAYVITMKRALTADPVGLVTMNSASVRVTRISGCVLGDCNSPLASFGLDWLRSALQPISAHTPAISLTFFTEAAMSDPTRWIIRTKSWNTR